ncbi:acetyltransferase [Pedobacter sp. KACC 23697]|uniref:Acetyltransferase n=1 Tax=Pedobacter sp. KACC 23697 TaxID=3149230 RepID=A0AAU7K3T1_9SPHI
MKRLFKTYGLLGMFSMLINKAYTILFIKNARLIRLPIDLRGKSTINFGSNLTTGKYCRLEAIVNDNSMGNKLVFGNNVTLNDMVHIAASNSVVIGDNVLIASKVFISDHNHGSYSENGSSPLSHPNEREIVARPVVIGEDVWIGEFVAILPGVKVGKGSIIGAMSVVNKDIPPYSIAVGSPAKVVKKYNFTSEKWERV